MSEPFIAEIRIFAGNFAPRGWAFCDGQLMPIAQNTALFSLLGTTYGGDGRSTTALPNLQGRAPMHPGRGPGLTSRRLGERGGVETVTLTEAQMPSHTHQLRGDEDAGEQNTPVANVTATVRANQRLYAAPAALGPMAARSAGVVGGSQGHENMHPFLAINYIIALVGLYPSRS